MSTSPGLSLDDQLCFALYAASRAVTARYRPLLHSLGITYPQYLVLLVLWERGPVSVGELGRRLQLDSGTVSPLLSRLADAGLVRRRRRPGDERSVEVTLTATGRALRRKATVVPAQMCAAMGLPDAERDRLSADLRELAGRLDGAMSRPA